MTTRRNPILATDSYKFSHFMQYPKGATTVYSHVVARGSKIEGCDEVVFLGLQAFIKDFLMEPITLRDVDEAEAFCAKHGTPFNREGWEIIVKDHSGMLPIKIEAVPEGTVVPVGNVLLQIHNIDERLPWLTSYVETVLLQAIWYPSTVATISREIKKVIKKNLDLTSDNPDAELPFKLHDFGYRGVSSRESAAIGGFAHLVNFMGTDTVAGIEHAMNFYNAGVCGFSISASEHSTMTSWGLKGEYDAYANMVKSYAKKGAIFACVIDSYDIDHAIDLWTKPQLGNKSLTDQVKEAGATVVLRPDSGDPCETPVHVIKRLINILGSTQNSKDFAVLPDHVRVIQGDGIDIDDVIGIYEMMYEEGLSASNIAFGMGGGLLQKVNRDTFKFAMKANAIIIDGEVRDVMKNPSGDPTKASRAGILKLVSKEGKYQTLRSEVNPGPGFYRCMHKVYQSFGGLTSVVNTDLDQIRARAALK